LFTAFAVAGIANSVNIIDGFNGLASGVVVLMLLTLGSIAYSVGDTAVLNLALLGAAVVLGFMAVNYPRGYIFLGDAVLTLWVTTWLCWLWRWQRATLTR